MEIRQPENNMPWEVRGLEQGTGIKGQLNDSAGFQAKTPSELSAVMFVIQAVISHCSDSLTRLKYWDREGILPFLRNVSQTSTYQDHCISLLSASP